MGHHSMVWTDQCTHHLMQQFEDEAAALEEEAEQDQSDQQQGQGQDQQQEPGADGTPQVRFTAHALQDSPDRPTD
jgi:hypothetical protein